MKKEVKVGVEEFLKNNHDVIDYNIPRVVSQCGSSKKCEQEIESLHRLC